MVCKYFSLTLRVFHFLNDINYSTQVLIFLCSPVYFFSRAFGVVSKELKVNSYVTL